MTRITATSHERITLPSGLVLEASLSVPPTVSGHPQTANKLAVCLHPWSWLGGRMDDPVLHTLKNPLLTKGYHVLRYNSRGVGKSSGWPSFTGLQEAQDLQELVRWALDKIPAIDTVVIVGYSHGSLITSLFPLFPEDKPITVSHVLLSYPLGPRSWLTAFQGNHYTSSLRNLLQEGRSRVLVLYGDQDNFTGVESYDAWADSLRAAVQEDGKATLQIVKVHRADHFWVDDQAKEMLVDVVRNFA